MLFFHGNGILSDPGTGWHLQTGRIMLSRHALVRTDPYSFTHGGSEWITFEWLSEVVYGLAEKTGGPAAVAFLACFLFALVPVLLFRFLLRHGVMAPFALFYVGAGLFIFQLHVLARPHAFTYLFFLILLIVLSTALENGPRWQEWVACPLLFLFWANLHGGFFAGLLLMACLIFGEVMDRWQARRSWKRFLAAWGLLGMTCFVVTFLNPHGWRLHWKIWEILCHLPSLAYWDEFRSPNLADGSPLSLTLLALIFSFLILPGLAGRFLAWRFYFPMVVFLLFGFRSQRHIFLVLLLGALPWCQLVQAVLMPWMRSSWREKIEQWTKDQLQLRSDSWVIGALTLGFAYLMLVFAPHLHWRVTSDHLSSGAQTFIKSHPLHFQKTLTTPRTGGALIYYCYPQVKTSFDDRADFYGERANREEWALVQMNPGWRGILEKYSYDSAVLNSEDNLVVGLQSLPGWHEVFSDSVNVIFFHESDRSP